MSAGNDLTFDYWVYPLRWGETLATNEWIEWQFHRFLTSRFVAYTVHENSRAEAFTAMLLWSESYRQDPAGTLPDDDVELMGLARVTSMADWLAMKPLVLRGWTSCAIDGERHNAGARLGNDVIAKIASDSYRRKAGRVQSRESGTINTKKSRIRDHLEKMGHKKLAGNNLLVTELAEYLERNGKMWATAANVAAALEIVARVPRVVPIRGD